MRVDVIPDDCWSPAAIALSVVEVKLLSLDSDVAALQSPQRNDRSKSGIFAAKYHEKTVITSTHFTVKFSGIKQDRLTTLTENRSYRV